MTLAEFAGLSVVLTGFDKTTILPDFDTQHMAQEYLDVLNNTGNVPADTLSQLTRIWNSIAAGTPPDEQEAAVKQQIMNNPDKKISRLAQNIIYMWYLATWYDLSKDPSDFTGKDFVVSSKAYQNGLAWKAFDAHPMGFSEDVFGYWSTVPEMP